METKRVFLDVSPELHLTMKLYATDNSMTLKTLLQLACEEYIANHAKTDEVKPSK